MEGPEQPLLFHNHDAANPSRHSYYSQEDNNYGHPVAPPNTTPYQQPHGQGYTQQHGQGYIPFHGTTPGGHTQYGYGFPPPPQIAVAYQGPRAVDYYPPPDPNQPEEWNVPKPMMKIESHYKLALFLCAAWGILLIWPSWIFVALALWFAWRSEKHIKANSYDQARKDGKTACFCSVCSLAATSVYLVTLFVVAYVTINVFRSA